MTTYSADEIRDALTPDQVCTALKISRSKLYRARSAGEIGYVRVGDRGRVRYPQRAVLAYANTAR